ncbi:origin recognition complex subunit 5 C-terminus-domain-containing protein [Gilbertella persicaria]|uniref:origin recognition complex subunit 5 C-terminus-domain-containing protein n=1 Tax=Gilbertella persicaria TaxID=101096 RepID=UPI00222085F8|nr:origin recognition complex subunit 5 C-terminus-domain-containing protein [Gilbertella persicaria]KAI8087840.1 origin recognition complex subunit 5 C-terminus-domain-containing protein [Gilbertella persicaria]
MKHDLKQRFPGREKQIDQLSYVSYGSQQNDYSPQSIFIYGPPSTGKTTLVTEFFAPFALYVNCIECFTPRLLFERAFDALEKHQPSHLNQYSSLRKIDTAQQLVRAFKETLCPSQPTYYLVLDHAERIRDMPGHILPVLLRLSELTERNICVVMISNIVFEKFRIKGGSMDPYLIRFPEYTREDTLRILQLDYQVTDDLDLDFYTGFLQVIYAMFQINCKDINELRYLASLLYPIYIKPIQEGRLDKKEKARLLHEAKPYFANATEKLYLREISSAEWTQDMQANGQSTPDIELPFYTKFLLIAAYLASYNPPRFDVRYFAKTAEERKKKKGGGTRKGRVDRLGGKMRQQLLGPKAFPVERMLAIFYSILEDSLEDTVDIQLQITSLTTLRLLVRTTQMERLDTAKYKCNVNFEFIRSIAKSVRFEIEHYLYDFN